MDSGPTSEQIRRAQFRNVLRGLDRESVEAFLTSVADRVDELEAERARLVEQLGQVGARDLETEFDAIGREVSGILQAAREAADSMRERASLDSTKWRAETMAEVEASRRTAAADAEALRRDAWVTGTELLKQATEESQKQREQAERDVLTVMGEAEREAHRLTSGARREAEDMVRAAAMDAEKMTSEAVKRRDDLIDAANRQASAAQERTRALEQRRDELLEELENVRSTLTRLEGSLAEKRESMDLSSSDFTTVRVVPSRPPVVEEGGQIRTWEPGETVRVIRPEPPPVPDQVPEPEPVEEKPPLEEPEEGLAVPSDEAIEPPAREVFEEIAEEAEETKVGAQAGDDVGALFASLRGGEHAPEVTAARPEAPEAVAETPRAPVAAAATTDWIDIRDARLLPITNRALRGAKKSITELQNIALDSLRTDEAWRPDPHAVGETLQGELIAVWSESFAAGHAVAEEMTGSKLKRPATPQSEAVEGFATHLAEAVARALEEAGEGQRERQSAASRVFRVWRTDEAERRIRELAIHAYERGVELSASSVS